MDLHLFEGKEMRDTIDMAREAGMESNEYMLYEALAHTAWVCDSGDLERFAALVRADEREACAKECDACMCTAQASEAIRARGQA
jgi:hypothetical protein